jgi:hypothetical protein
MSILVGPVTLSATGGTISSITGYKVHIFDTPGVSTFIPGQNGTIEVLVVGGGGGWSYSNGGGAVIYNKLANVTSGTPYPITVGAVGSPTGGISSCIFNNATLIAYGGGAGNGVPSPFASGGGSWGGSAFGVGAGTTGLGFPGGGSPSPGSGGGGGGAGNAGTPAPTPTIGGNGGIGVSYSITGTSQYYGGGQGGFNYPGSLASPNGGIPGASYGTGGTPGAVIIRYPV